MTFNVGLEYRGGRMALFKMYERYDFIDMDDVINLHAGANYRLNSKTSLWLKAHNLLNRRYDLLYGQGAQRMGVMAGVSLTF